MKDPTCVYMCKTVLKQLNSVHLNCPNSECAIPIESVHHVYAFGEFLHKLPTGAITEGINSKRYFLLPFRAALPPLSYFLIAPLCNSFKS